MLQHDSFSGIADIGTVTTCLIGVVAPEKLWQLKPIEIRLWMTLVTTRVSIFHAVLLRLFVRTLPRDLHEASVIDDAHPIQVFWHIIVPLSHTALITVSIFSGLFVWDDFLDPLIYLNDERHVHHRAGTALVHRVV